MAMRLFLAFDEKRCRFNSNNYLWSAYGVDLCRCSRHTEVSTSGPCAWPSPHSTLGLCLFLNTEATCTLLGSCPTQILDF